MSLRQHLRVEGVVQGVGFRPHVYRLARSLSLSGFVGNDSQGVFIEVEGEPASLEAFRRQLIESAPPAAYIERLTHRDKPATGETDFTIVPSQAQENIEVLVSPDLDCCPDCLAELDNPADRRYGYPFINCTNCGPRFTIIRSLPYDRPRTTMAEFTMCKACHTEYDDPGDRRFHAQPNACPECGPSLSLPLPEVLAALAAGQLVAIKGVGGYHLACDAFNAHPIRRLRARKGRFSKPFAVMVADLETARQLAYVSPAEEALLSSRHKPIVLLSSRHLLPDEVAPGVDTLGLMLPYTPLHHLLLQQQRALVMTSANLSSEPIISTAEPALDQLADLVVHHDRPIEMACDDSVVRVYREQALPLRRSRGYAPFPVELPFEVPPSLAVGAQMKSTFCLGRGRHAFLSQHLGDLESLETLEFFRRAVAHLSGLYRLEPEYLCADLHPGYLSTRWAEEQSHPVLRVQHHHAHLAALMAEHGLPAESRILGLVFDGTGLGTDGTIWGGELLEAGYADFERKAYLTSVPMAGGDAAVREPWRMAAAHLWAAGLPWPQDAPLVLRQQLERAVNTVPTSSMGRLFDAVAALIGLRRQVDYEAQAAIEIEGLADRTAPGSYGFGYPLDPAPVLSAILTDLAAGCSPGAISMRFHRGLAEACLRLCREHDRGLPVGLSGGVFQNMLLLDLVVTGLENAGFTVLTHRLVPPNDGGLALGQLVIAACQWKGARPCA
ncbi:MAG: carbamoyltransferase HypF [Vulcanimicrobiota bacterium]